LDLLFRLQRPLCLALYLKYVAALSLLKVSASAGAIFWSLPFCEKSSFLRVNLCPIFRLVGALADFYYWSRFSRQR
jgi:hypothetical protein